MAQVEFNYNNAITIIQCNMQDKMFNIIQKFLLKCQKKLDDIFFLYDGQTLGKEKTFKEQANEMDKIRKKMNVIVKDKHVEQKALILEKSKYVICPECNECTRIIMRDNKISLYECKNGHRKDNILFNEFEKTQYINLSKIVCDNCKKTNKSETFENKFYICYSCKMNLCPLCKNSHNKTHDIIDYEQKDFICRSHHDIFISYCNDNNCKKDICTLCQKDHIGHKLIAYGDILPDIDKSEINKTKEKINEYKNNIKEVISKLNNYMEKLDSYYNIYSNIINNFDIRKRNYSIMQNVNDMINYNKNIIKNIDIIVNNKTINNILNNIVILESQNDKDKKSDKTNEKNDIDDEDDRKYSGPLIYDDGNIICNIVEQNLIIQYKDKKLCIMTDEFIKKKNTTTKNGFIKETVDINLTIDNNLKLFDKNPNKYFDNLKTYLNNNGDSAHLEDDEDEGVTYYCLITKKTIKELNELNKMFCLKEKDKKKFWPFK